MTSIPTRKIEMKTVQQMLDLKPTTLCPALYKWSIKAAAMLRTQAAENEALKADAERYRKIKPSFVWDNENSHGHWACYIPSTMWGPDGEPDAAIDAMKGAT